MGLLLGLLLRVREEDLVICGRGGEFMGLLMMVGRWC